MNFNLEPGDTKPEDFIYGREFTVILHGKALPRNFRIIYCPTCNNQIKAGHVDAPPSAANNLKEGHKYTLDSDSRFNKKVFCCKKCAGHSLKVDKSKHVKTKPPQGYQTPVWTPEQLKRVARYIYNPAGAVLR